MRPPLITEIKNMNQLMDILTKNPGVVIIKFGAEWCGPCKLVNSLIHDCINKMPDNVQCAVIDIDISFEIYAFLKKKRIVNGVPVILAYHKDNSNITYVPSDLVIGADKPKIIDFFNRCISKAIQ